MRDDAASLRVCGSAPSTAPSASSWRSTIAFGRARLPRHASLTTRDPPSASAPEGVSAARPGVPRRRLPPGRRRRRRCPPSAIPRPTRRRRRSSRSRPGEEGQGEEGRPPRARRHRPPRLAVPTSPPPRARSRALAGTSPASARSWTSTPRPSARSRRGLARRRRSSAISHKLRLGRCGRRLGHLRRLEFPGARFRVSTAAIASLASPSSRALRPRHRGRRPRGARISRSAAQSSSEEDHVLLLDTTRLPRPRSPADSTANSSLSRARASACDWMSFVDDGSRLDEACDRFFLVVAYVPNSGMKLDRLDSIDTWDLRVPRASSASARRSQTGRLRRRPERRPRAARPAWRLAHVNRAAVNAAGSGSFESLPAACCSLICSFSRSRAFHPGADAPGSATGRGASGTDRRTEDSSTTSSRRRG